MAQFMKCLPYKHEDLSSMPRTLKKKLGIASRWLESHHWEGGPSTLLASQPGLIDELEANKRPCLKQR